MYIIEGAGMNAISLFSGAGGLDLGFEESGIDILLAGDHWNCAVDTYVANRPGKTKIIRGDVNKHKSDIVDFGRKKKPDIIFGGPPCQDFSSAGWRTGYGNRADLTLIFSQIAAKVKPTWVVMENVNTILSIGQSVIRRSMETLRRAGYGLTPMVLNSVDYGVPQLRKRFVLVARHNGHHNEMLPIMNSLKTNQQVTVKQYLPQIARGKNKTQYYYRHPWTFARRAIFSVDEPSPTIRGVNRPIPPSYKPHMNDATKNLSIVRPLSTSERAIIQTFPKDYVLSGTKTEKEQQIGNSVPPLLARAIADAIQLAGK